MKYSVPEEEDYLNMVSPPTYDAPKPHYVNLPSNKTTNNESDGSGEMLYTISKALLIKIISNFLILNNHNQNIKPFKKIFNRLFRYVILDHNSDGQ